MQQVDDYPTIRGSARSRSPRRARYRRGVSAIEYTMMISFISIGVVAAVQHLGGSMSDIFDNVSSGILSEDDGSKASDTSPSKGETGPSSGGNGKLEDDGGKKAKKASKKAKKASKKAKSKGSNKHG